MDDTGIGQISEIKPAKYSAVTNGSKILIIFNLVILVVIAFLYTQISIQRSDPATYKPEAGWDLVISQFMLVPFVIAGIILGIVAWNRAGRLLGERRPKSTEDKFWASLLILSGIASFISFYSVLIGVFVGYMGWRKSRGVSNG